MVAVNSSELRTTRSGKKTTRGGSFYDYREGNTRCAFRFRCHSLFRDGGGSFRVVVNGARGKNGLELKVRRVLRGGSFYGDRRFGRSASRYRRDPHYRDVNFGFRVVVSRVERETTRRVLRGCSFDCRVCTRSAARNWHSLYFRFNSRGFRVVVNRVRGRDG